MVRLTPAGRSAIEAAAPNHVMTVRHFLFDPLSDHELETLAVLLDRLVAQLRQGETLPPNRAETGDPPGR